jgi:hypothetical protein
MPVPLPRDTRTMHPRSCPPTQYPPALGADQMPTAIAATIFSTTAPASRQQLEVLTIAKIAPAPRGRTPPAAASSHRRRQKRAGLLRLLGTALHEAGELDRAEAVVAEGSRAAAAVGTAALAARIGILLTEVRASKAASETRLSRVARPPRPYSRQKVILRVWPRPGS